MEDQDIVREFLLESNENLVRLDQEIVELEKRPKDANLLASIFRTVHSIKGTCGFLGFSILEGVAHQGENILSQLRSGQREVTEPLISLILECIDAIKAILSAIEDSGAEGSNEYGELKARLEAVAKQASEPAAVTDSGAPPNVASLVAASSETTPPGNSHPTALPSLPETSGSPASNSPASGGDVVNPDGAVPDVGNMDILKLDAVNPGVVYPDVVIPEAFVSPQPPLKADLEPSSPVQAASSVSGKSEEKSVSVSDSAIRVNVGLLDKLMNLVGELVLARNQVLQFNTQWEDVALNATSQRLNLITTELQEGVMKTRMQPIGLVWNKLPRLVRDVSHSLGKQVKLEMDGAHTELDKTIIEAIKDPLTHLVRNACDHGLERPEDRIRAGKSSHGTVTLRAYHEGGQVNIEISDDGAGMDVEKLKQKAIDKGICSTEHAKRMSDREALNLIFSAGFSTAKTITNVSGRGVGMDVVKSNIERIGGAVDVTTQLGQWTTVKLKIPLTLAIIPGLVVTSGNERCVIPQVSLLELIRLDSNSAGKIEHVHGTPVYRRRGSLLPIAYLSDILGLPATESDTVNIVVLQAEDRQFGLIVGSVNDTQEIVVKPLGKQLKGLAIYAGATIMGDGKVALILDILGVGRQSGVLTNRHENERGGAQMVAPAGDEKQRLLLFSTTSFERLSVPLSLVSRLEEFPQTAIEFTGDSPVVQYRGGILPLLSLESILTSGGEDQALKQDPAQVIVFQHGDQSVGIVVERIVDILEEVVSIRRKSDRAGLLGSAVVGKQVTDFVDLKAILNSTLTDWFSGSAAQRTEASLLLAEPSPFVRSLLRAELEMAGYWVTEAASVGEALERIENHSYDVLLAATDLPDGGCRQLFDAVRQRLPRARTIGLSGAGTDDLHTGCDFDDIQSKYDRSAMLQSIERLASALAADTRAGERETVEEPVAG